jgi:ssDNA-binding Zn-finger/Zn-ribbon topoisomerase 1
MIVVINQKIYEGICMKKETRNLSIKDQKCPTCGSWMKHEMKKSEKGMDIITYSCPECGLTYSADG